MTIQEREEQTRCASCGFNRTDVDTYEILTSVGDWHAGQLAALCDPCADGGREYLTATIKGESK